MIEMIYARNKFSSEANLLGESEAIVFFTAIALLVTCSQMAATIIFTMSFITSPVGATSVLGTSISGHATTSASYSAR